jgi:hypothetical protein
MKTKHTIPELERIATIVNKRVRNDCEHMGINASEHTISTAHARYVLEAAAEILPIVSDPRAGLRRGRIQRDDLTLWQVWFHRVCWDSKGAMRVVVEDKEGRLFTAEAHRFRFTDIPEAGE